MTRSEEGGLTFWSRGGAKGLIVDLAVLKMRPPTSLQEASSQRKWTMRHSMHELHKTASHRFCCKDYFVLKQNSSGNQEDIFFLGTKIAPKIALKGNQ